MLQVSFVADRRISELNKVAAAENLAQVLHHFTQAMEIMRFMMTNSIRLFPSELTTARWNIWAVFKLFTITEGGDGGKCNLFCIHICFPGPRHGERYADFIFFLFCLLI